MNFSGQTACGASGQTKFSIVQNDGHAPSFCENRFLCRYAAYGRSICGLAPTRYAKFRYAHFARYVPLCGTLWTDHTTKNLSSRKLLIKKFSRTGFHSVSAKGRTCAGLLHNRKFTVRKFSGGKRWVPEAPCKYAHKNLKSESTLVPCTYFEEGKNTAELCQMKTCCRENNRVSLSDRVGVLARRRCRLVPSSPAHFPPSAENDVWPEKISS